MLLWMPPFALAPFLPLGCTLQMLPPWPRAVMSLITLFFLPFMYKRSPDWGLAASYVMVRGCLLDIQLCPFHAVIPFLRHACRPQVYVLKTWHLYVLFRSRGRSSDTQAYRYR
jgi:hypothetical protein